MKKLFEKNMLIFTIIISIILHFLIVLGLHYTHNNIIKKEPDITTSSINVSLEDIDKLRKLFSKEKLQIVDLQDDNKTKFETPKNAKYASDKNRTVDIETKARNASYLLPGVPKHEKKINKDQKLEKDKNDQENKPDQTQTSWISVSKDFFSQKGQKKSYETLNGIANKSSKNLKIDLFP